MGSFSIIHADVMDGLRSLPDASFGACFCDPPYGLASVEKRRPGWKGQNAGGRGFMGLEWDAVIPGPEVWAEVLRVLKPGAPLLAFGGTRTYHRLACAIEDAGFALADTLCWLYGSGFPKGHAQLKPAWEPITLAWKKGKRVLAIDAGRIGTTRNVPASHSKTASSVGVTGISSNRLESELDPNIGRWPANVLLDEDAAAALDAASAGRTESKGHFPKLKSGDKTGWSGGWSDFEQQERHSEDSGGASRFFYIAKADSTERNASGPNGHPTVKPVDLCAYLSKLILPGEGARLIVPFSGSGSEIMGALRAGWSECVGIEKEAEYVELSRRRIQGDAPMFNTESDAVCNIG